MNVLFFTHALEGGGAETQLRYLAGELAQQGIQVHVAYVSGDFGKLMPAGVIGHRLSQSSNYSPALLAQILSLLGRIRPDIVQTWSIKFDVLLGVCRLMRRFNWIVRESNNRQDWVQGIKDRLRIFLARRANLIVANSPLGAEYWRQQGASTVEVIENGYDLGMLAGIEACRPDVSGEYLCYLGRLSAHKRVDRLLAAFAAGAPDSASLLIIGDGDQREVLAQQAKALGIERRVQFAGFLPQRQALGLVKGARAMALLSDYEGTPNVVIEAQRLGTPVLLSDSDSHRSFFPDDVALFVNSADTQAVASAVSALFDDGTTRQRLVEAAGSFTASRSLRAMADRYLARYRDLSRSPS